jgi:hypothetical protein
MHVEPRRGRRLFLVRLCLAAVLSLGLAGCSIKLVADYQEASVDQLLSIYAEVDRFYDRLAETEPAGRTYEAFQDGWSSIATDLRTFALRQDMRELNGESAEIADMLVKTWESERAEHKRSSADPARRADPYPATTIALDREQFEGWFYTAVSAEKFKN